MRKIVFIMMLFLSSSVLAAVQTSDDLFKDVEISVAGGMSWLKTSSTQTVVSAFETDNNNVRNVINHPAWKIGIGRSFFDDTLQRRQFLNRLLVELNLYQSQSSIKGSTWQYQLPQFNNFDFSAPVKSTRLMLDFKPFLFTAKTISLYPILGFGVAWNEFNYTETPTASGINPASAAVLRTRMRTNFAYEIGAGVRTQITEHFSAALEYLYNPLGHVSPSTSSETAAMILVAPQFAIRMQTVLLSVNWKI